MVRTSLGLPVEIPPSNRASSKRRPPNLCLPSASEDLTPSPASAIAGVAGPGAHDKSAQPYSARPWTASAAALSSHRERLAGSGGGGGRRQPGDLDGIVVSAGKATTLHRKSGGPNSACDARAGTAVVVSQDRNPRPSGVSLLYCGREGLGWGRDQESEWR
jgi:hypothetical protein